MVRLKHQSGFTLIESIVTIVIVGIIAGTVSLIIGNYVSNYHDTSRRTMLQTSAQLAIERISREVRHALPNSICTPNAASACVPTSNRLYFVRVKDAGYYQDTPGLYPDGATATSPLPIIPNSAATFDVVSDNTVAGSHTANGLFAAANDWIVVHNINNADIYAGNNRRMITAINPMNVDGAGGNDILRITVSNTNGFPLQSPQRRFHVVENNTRILHLQGTNLFLADSTNLTNPNTVDVNNDNLLLQNVTNLAFSFDAGSPQRTGLLHIDLTVESEGEQIRLIHEAHVYNVP